VGKRSTFERRPRDAYMTPPSAVVPLLPFLLERERFCEPCAGDGKLRDFLVSQGHVCAAAWDIKPQGPRIDRHDATTRLIGNITSFITNPPWERDVLHRMIEHFTAQAPTWLLLDADWMHTRQAAPYWPRCSMVVSIGRVKWIADSKSTGKDNCCWYRFTPGHLAGPQFIGRDPVLFKVAA
jgi:hypothetical protein